VNLDFETKLRPACTPRARRGNVRTALFHKP
jgi:hypothetical protein